MNNFIIYHLEKKKKSFQNYYASQKQELKEVFLKNLGWKGGEKTSLGSSIFIWESIHKFKNKRKDQISLRI